LFADNPKKVLATTWESKNILDLLLDKGLFHIADELLISANESPLIDPLNNQKIKLSDKSQALIIATNQKDLTMMSALLKAAPYLIDVKDSDGLTPLYIAAENGNLEVIRFLLEKGANVNQAEKSYGATPLFIAVQNGHLEVIKFLIEKGANVNQATTDDGATPLYVAAYKGHLEVIKLLLEKGADVNQATTDNATPLYIAVQQGHFEVIKLLIEQGADIHQKAKNGKSPLDIAREKGYESTFICLNFIKKQCSSSNVYIDIHQQLLNDYSRASSGSRLKSADSRFFHGQWENHYGDLVAEVLLKNKTPFKNKDDLINFYTDLVTLAYQKGKPFESKTMNKKGTLWSIIEITKNEIDFFSIKPRTQIKENDKNELLIPINSPK
jgi:ankyrin repeat protein